MNGYRVGCTEIWSATEEMKAAASRVDCFGMGKDIVYEHVPSYLCASSHVAE